MEVSLATAESDDSSLTVPISAPTDFKLDIDEHARSTFLSTKGGCVYPIRKALAPVTMTSNNATGDILFVQSLDVTMDPIFATLAQRFIYYRFISIALAFRTTAPWGTASGSAQILVNPDPENPISTDKVESIQQSMRLMESRQLSSKGEITAQVPIHTFNNPILGGFRWCKSAAVSNPRLQSYGQLAMIVRGVPAFSDGTSWTCTLTAAIEFSMATFNSSLASYKIGINSTIDHTKDAIVPSTNGSNDFLVSLTGSTTGKASTGYFSSFNPIEGTVKLTEPTDDDPPVDYSETCRISCNTCSYVDDGTSCTFLVPIQDIQNSNLASPTTATIETMGVDRFVGYGIYNDTSTLVQGHSLASIPERDAHQSADCFMGHTSSLNIPRSHKQRIINRFLEINTK